MQPCPFANSQDEQDPELLAVFFIEAAIGYVPELSFTIADHFMLGALSNVKGRTITVKMTKLANILDRCEFRSINLISDIEGAEIDLVKNELPIMRDRVKSLIVETHPHHTGDQAANAD